MSRETDSPSSGPHGRGGAAYPSGTPPYGTPTASDGGTQEGRSAARPEERKTETTLTTRIRINIPGSRPIPPVVVRKPVGDAESADGPEAEAPAPGAATTTGTVEPPAPAEPAAQAEEKTSDWFAPRKSPAPKGAQSGGSGNAPGAPAGSGAAAPASGAGSRGSGAAPSGGARPAGGPGRPGGVVGAVNLPGGGRPGTGGSGLPGATGGPVAPGHGGGTGSFDVTEALAAGPLGNGGRATEPRRDDVPYGPENERDGRPSTSAPGGHNGRNGQNPQAGYAGYGGGPAGPTGGPVTGDGPLAPPAAPGAPAGPGTAPTGAPAGPGTAPTGAPLPGGGLSDDTAVLTPQKQVPEPPPGAGFRTPPHDNVSGHTVTSGIPVVPDPDRDAGFPPAGPAAPAAPAQQSAPAAAPRKKKGRSKLVLLGGGVIALAGVAYGAGLLMNHSDVPKGTTVLGVDIGGGTRDDAVKKLDEALGDRVDDPIKLTVGGDPVTLRPDQAGLSLDTQSTVREAAASDYNPVSVIGSLFGEQRVVEPVMPVDEEKLHAALEKAAGGAGTASDGTIRFVSGKAVPVYGKPGKGVDVDGATDAVAAAYRAQVETGTAETVALPTTTRQPTVSDAEVDRMMKEFAQPAMSGFVTVRTDAAHSIKFSPENSLWRFLRVKAVDGKLVDSPDLAALEKLYGSTFDGVLITRATGEKTPVTPQDVYGALRTALMSETNRTAVIETNPN
ncbi:hypothetical protein [Streptomyces sp. JB150]|uniref:hypothetical protein n=1 Tax=Streptomyces sp. JB150 TaxID=2714844 RepID=UPI00140D8E84|nr:hypothetical protein [Streptomyces sp. JB150]QIJ64581.1 hypothetical protein G7Z13_23130 [Streptomyces sp. JB150]